MSQLFREFSNLFTYSKAHNRLIIINVSIFVILQLLRLVLFLFNLDISFYHFIIRELSVPAYFDELIFKPWTIITYMFLHEDFMHLLFNMLFLYWFGNIYQDYLGNNKVVYTYLGGGIIGAVLFIMAFNIFPVFSDLSPSPTALGASAGIMAIVVATATLIPNYNLFLILIGPVSLRIIAIFFVVLDLLSISRDNPGGHIAHLGGAIFGFIFIRQLKNGHDSSAGFEKFSKRFMRFFKKEKQKVSVVHRRRPLSDEEYNASKKNKQELIDEILDKIAKSGYDSLSKKEKEILFKISKDEL